MSLYFRLSGEPPMPPPDADFSFRIIFEKGQGDPRRVFDAASEMIDGFEELDEAITGSIDSKIRPLMVLEDIEGGSIRVWLSSLLKKVDDKALSDGDYKKAIGPALVEAKYATIAFLDNDKDAAAKGADQFRETLRGLAAKTDVRQLGDYAPIHEAKLIAALDSFQDAKRLLGPKDKLLLEAPKRRDYEVDLKQTWNPAEVVPITESTTEKDSTGEIILTIRKPDMTGDSKWLFTRGKYPVSAKIVDEEWLIKFRARKVPGFHSGDAMRCKVKFTYIFDKNGTMIDEVIEIKKVMGIIEGPGGEQIPMPL
jgi:hypothetical protein